MVNLNPKSTITLESVVTCPKCGFAKTEDMPIGSSQIVYKCLGCKTVLRPKKGNCCIFCSYGTVPCPHTQDSRDECF